VATLFAALATARAAAQEQQAAAAPQAMATQPDGGAKVPRLIKFSGGVNPQTTQILQNKDNESAKSQAVTQIALTFSLSEGRLSRLLHWQTQRLPVLRCASWEAGMPPSPSINGS